MKNTSNTSRSEVVIKTIQILKAFSKDNYLMGIPEIEEKVNLPKSTIQRLLATLEQEGFVKQDPISQKYSLGKEILALAGTILSSMNFRRIALPYMMNLSNKWQETIDLDVLDGADVIIVEQIPGQYALRVGSPLIRRLPAHITSTGKVLLAYAGTEYIINNLPEDIQSNLRGSNKIIRRDQLIKDLEVVTKQGFSQSRGELEEYVYAIAVPIFDISKRVIAAMSVSGFVPRIDTNEEEIIIDLKNAAKEISKQLLSSI